MGREVSRGRPGVQKLCIRSERLWVCEYTICFIGEPPSTPTESRRSGAPSMASGSDCGTGCAVRVVQKQSASSLEDLSKGCCTSYRKRKTHEKNFFGENWMSGRPAQPPTGFFGAGPPRGAGSRHRGTHPSSPPLPPINFSRKNFFFERFWNYRNPSTKFVD